MTQIPSHSSFDNVLLQEQSPLFQLPGELRDNIYNATLAAFEDKDKLYDINTYWARPRYSAPRKSDLTLLRVCKRIYHEAWFKPWTFADHSFWLGSYERAPGSANRQLDRLEKAVSLVHQHQGDVEIEHVRFFTQLWAFEQGYRMQNFCGLDHFHPVAITITIRHTDWWWWEDDNLLMIRCSGLKLNRYPASVRTISMELESLERKKDQVDSIAKQMKDWYFTKLDQTLLSACEAVDVERWRGSSTWAGQRWVRDESDAHPDCLDYYVVTVKFQHHQMFTPQDMDDLVAVTSSKPIQTNQPTIHVQLPLGISASKAVEMVNGEHDFPPLEGGFEFQSEDDAELEWYSEDEEESEEASDMDVDLEYEDDESIDSDEA